MKNKITTAEWDAIQFNCEQIIKYVDVNQSIKWLIDFGVLPGIIPIDLSLMEYFELEMVVLYAMIKRTIEEERYEIAANIRDVINLEKQDYKNYIDSLLDEELKDEFYELFNLTNMINSKQL